MYGNTVVAVPDGGVAFDVGKTRDNLLLYPVIVVVVITVIVVVVVPAYKRIGLECARRITLLGKTQYEPDGAPPFQEMPPRDRTTNDAGMFGILEKYDCDFARLEYAEFRLGFSKCRLTDRHSPRPTRLKKADSHTRFRFERIHLTC